MIYAYDPVSTRYVDISCWGSGSMLLPCHSKSYCKHTHLYNLRPHATHEYFETFALFLLFPFYFLCRLNMITPPFRTWACLSPFLVSYSHPRTLLIVVRLQFLYTSIRHILLNSTLH